MEGQPGAPITFEPLVPGQRWISILYGSLGSGPRLDYVTVKGSEAGIVASDSIVKVTNGLFQNNLRGGSASTYGILEVEKSRFLDNAIGINVTETSTARLYHPSNPNAFEGNDAAVNADNNSDARLNWWGHPSGPQHPDNPDGQGDPVTGFGAVQVLPFLTEPPNFDNQPPVVRAVEPYFYVEPGDKLILQWSAEDDDEIVEQRLLFSDWGNYTFDEIIVDGLPASQHSYQWTVPDVGVIGSSSPSPYVRIEAVDSSGQIGWDEIRVDIPTFQDLPGEIQFTTDFQDVYLMDEREQICFTEGDIVDAWLFLEGDRSSVALGGTTTNCLSGEIRMPFVSTDSARVGVRIYGAANRFRWFFSESFAIRPDPRLGDAPPSVTMLTPQGGETFLSGSPIPISWSASDDEALRSFDIQASYDGGQTWQLIAEELPADATSFAWDNAPNAALDEVRVRVIARDLRFQNTSDGAERVFAITPGNPTALTLTVMEARLHGPPWSLALIAAPLFGMLALALWRRR